MGWNYSDRTKQLFMDAVHGKPGTHMGEIENADGFGEYGSIACGDAMRFTFKVEKHPTDPSKDIITQARYLTFGCTSAIASSEALCFIIEDRRCSPIEALKVSNDDIVDFLEGLPSQKIHCSVMGAEALEAAVFNWAQKRGVDLQEHGIHIATHDEDDGRIVCKCFNVTEPFLRRKIHELQLRTIPDITNAVKAGGACLSCHHVPGGLQDLLDDEWGARGTSINTSADTSDLVPPAPSAPHIDAQAPSPLSPYQFAKRVEEVIERDVRPELIRDGGDIEIVDIKETLVYCRLRGACAGCAGAQMTLKFMVERTLKDKVDQKIQVIAL